MANQSHEPPDLAGPFLASLFGEKPDPGLVSIFTLPDRKAQRFADCAQAAAHAVEQATAQNVYVGCCLVRPDLAGSGRGGAADVVAMPGLWADIDFAAPWHKGADKLAPQDAIIALAHSLPLAPSTIIASGGGLQLWWIFKEPWVFDSPEEHAQAGELAARWTATLQSWAARRGITAGVDSTGDLARVLRIPGTMNHNATPHTGHPLPVAILEQNTQRYNPSDFDEYLIADMEQSSTSTESSAESDGFTVSLSWGQILKPHGWKHLYARDGAEFWQRPGKEGEGCSAQTGGKSQATGFSGFWVYSSNAAPFEQSKGYTKIRAYALLNTDGDCQRAKEELSDKGLGDWPNAPDMGPDPYEASATPAAAPALDSAPPQDEPSPDDDGAIPAVQEYLTDLGNARRLVRLHGHDMRYVKEWGWLTWNGKRWIPDDRGQVMRWAKKTALSLYDDAANALAKAEKATREAQQKAAAGDKGGAARAAGDAEEHSDIAKALTKWAQASQMRQRLEAMVVLAQSEALVVARPDSFDADPLLFNCWNGTIDLHTGELRPHARRDMLTKLSPVEYDPAATCETWTKFLETATQKDAEFMAYLKRAAGYSLTGLTTEEVFYFLLGDTNTGKTTFGESLSSAMGDYAHKSSFDTFLARKDVGGARGDIADLQGARLVMACETDATRHLAEVMVKELSGGDRVRARHLYKEEFTFTPACKLWFAANESPKIKDTDNAIWRRLRRLPFEHVIPEAKRDPQVKAILRDPKRGGPAVLAWAVQGCLDWQKQGLGYPDIIRKKSAALRSDMDPLGDFFAECCVFAKGAKVPAGVLRAEYDRWCREQGEKEPVNSKEWGKRLRAKGATDKRERIAGVVTTVWQGVGLQETPQQGDLDMTAPPEEHTTPDEFTIDDLVTPVTPVTPESEKYESQKIQTLVGQFMENGVTEVTEVTDGQGADSNGNGAQVVEDTPGLALGVGKIDKTRLQEYLDQGIPQDEAREMARVDLADDGNGAQPEPQGAGLNIVDDLDAEEL